MTNDVQAIKVKELTKKIMNGDRLFIIDVRPTEDFEDWKVEGENVEIINKPYSELKKGILPIINMIPKNESVYIICAQGNSSKLVAEQIIDAGFNNVHSVEGGMKAWSEHLEPIKIADLTSGGSIYQFLRVGKGCLSYLIQSEGEAAIVDTSRMLKSYEQLIHQHNLKLTHLIDTHLHADHISGGKWFAEKVGATYHLPPKDADEVTYTYSSLEDGDVIKVGSTIIKAFYSPGHTVGSTSLIIDDNYLLTGDILFIDSIGRPDLAGKAEDWVGDLRETLYQRYKELTDDIIVLPGHFMGMKEMNSDGSVSRILGTLYKENHKLNVDSEKEFKKTVTDNLPPQPNSHQEIRDINMGKTSPAIEKQREMEIGPNRCAIS